MHAKWGPVAIVIWLAGCALLGPGADPDNDDDDTEGEGSSQYVGGGASGVGAIIPVAYSCYELSTMCRCDRRSGVSPGRCEYDWTCCIESANADTCECFDSDACAAEVASRAGTKQVQACPAGTELVPPACAATGANCTRDVLDESALEGCCDGLVCAPNESGVRVCRAGSEAESVLAAQCADDRSEGLTASGALATSEGEVAIGTADATLVDLGADGCVASFSLALSPAVDSANTFSCALRAQVGPARDEQGRLLVSGLQLFAMPVLGCTGFPPGVDGAYVGGTAGGTLEYEGFSCEGSLGSELCTAGRFTLVLDGELPGMRLVTDPMVPSDVSINFANATLTLEGRLCDYSPEGAACPVPQ